MERASKTTKPNTNKSKKKDEEEKDCAICSRRRMAIKTYTVGQFKIRAVLLCFPVHRYAAMRTPEQEKRAKLGQSRKNPVKPSKTQ